MAEAAPRKAFKDYFDRAAARSLAQQVGATYPRFDGAAFIRRATRGLGSLEFAGRVQRFSDALAAGLPAPPRALEILTRSLPEALPDAESVTDGWLQWPVGQFIADHGLEFFDASMEAMIELTQRFSSEFAVRPFVERYPGPTFARLLALTQHPSQHVRRWCSEGVRPRLPWGKQLRALVADPSPIWPIVEALQDDPEPYVRRSVANNLNDIAKDHPELVIRRCRSWKRSSNAQRDAMIAHALRTLIKAGDPQALAVVGFGPPKGITATLRIRPTKVAIGGAVELVAQVRSGARAPQSLLLDFVVHYVRKRGSTSPKVFKWTNCEIAAGETKTLTKRLAMRPTTTRSLHPGAHRIELQLNGHRVAEATLRLAAS